MTTKEKTETMDDTRAKLKEIYSFTVEKEEKVKNVINVNMMDYV